MSKRIRYYQCSFCENCYKSNKQKKEHEEICDYNNKTRSERFKAKVRQINEKNRNDN